MKNHVKYLPARRRFVLGFTVQGFRAFDRERRARALLDEIGKPGCFPGETSIIRVQGANYRFGRNFRWMRGARIK